MSPPSYLDPAANGHMPFVMTPQSQETPTTRVDSPLDNRHAFLPFVGMPTPDGKKMCRQRMCTI